jgi:hypothetical protein
MRATAKDPRVNKSFTIESDIEQYVSSTKGNRSASERVNDLLRIAITQEKYEQFNQEAANFFSSGTSRPGTKAFQEASLRTLARD